MENSENRGLTANWIFARLVCAIKLCTVKEHGSEVQ